MVSLVGDETGTILRCAKLVSHKPFLAYLHHIYSADDISVPLRMLCQRSATSRPEPEVLAPALTPLRRLDKDWVNDLQIALLALLAKDRPKLSLMVKRKLFNDHCLSFAWMLCGFGGVKASHHMPLLSKHEQKSSAPLGKLDCLRH